MMFAAFSSAMIVRKGLSNDWEAFRIPSVLWVNTLVLAASSVTLEVSRRSLASANHVRFAGWWYVSAALGLSFLLGQLAAWRELAARGVYLATNPAASFFYLLTAAHGLHLLGGVAGLIYVALRAGRYATAARSRTAVDVAALYWHFMDGLWVYLLALLLLGR
jgi:cytochrome c oxidase subunit 3